MEQVALYISSVLLNEDYLQITQTLQLFTKILKTEIIYKSNLNGKVEGLVDETKWYN